MKNLSNKLTLVSLSLGFSLGITGCTYSISEGINDQGIAQKIIFPPVEDAWIKQGTYPNSENLTKIRSGVSKDELYQLIGSPHFSEMQHAYEWDYIFKFVQPNDSVKTCQFKITFDKSMHGQTFHWLPETCGPSKKLTQLAPTHKQTFELSTDVLFRFDKSERFDVLPEGEDKVQMLAQKITAHESEGHLSIVVKGYTDHLGTEAYNKQLSFKRAQTVKQLLVENGLQPQDIQTYGVGESDPVTWCNETSHLALIDCLQPNRRVTIDVSVYPQ